MTKYFAYVDVVPYEGNPRYAEVVKRGLAALVDKVGDAPFRFYAREYFDIYRAEYLWQGAATTLDDPPLIDAMRKTFS